VTSLTGWPVTVVDQPLLLQPAGERSRRVQEFQLTMGHITMTPAASWSDQAFRSPDCRIRKMPEESIR
jgi:hypothetical protein